MTSLHMTRTQEKRFYRNAVQASLETFYRKSKPEATKLVRDWWTRLSSTKAFESGIFLHAEPMNTAANIADADVIAITDKNRAEYHRILDESRDHVLLKTLPSSAQIKKVPMDKPKQFLHITSSKPPISSRRMALRPASSSARENKPARKHQVAYS